MAERTPAENRRTVETAAECHDVYDAVRGVVEQPWSPSLHWETLLHRHDGEHLGCCEFGPPDSTRGNSALDLAALNVAQTSKETLSLLDRALRTGLECNWRPLGVDSPH